jgi:hypothetical protein
MKIMVFLFSEVYREMSDKKEMEPAGGAAVEMGEEKRKQGENDDPRRKADPKGLMLDRTPFEELEAMGEEAKTTNAKKSRVKPFLPWMESRDLKLPARAIYVQWFAAALTKWEYAGPKQYTPSVVMWLVQPVKPGEQARPVNGPALARHISDVEDAIGRTVHTHISAKADPVVRGKHWSKLSKKDRCIASLWFLMSVRGDTFEGLWEHDFDVPLLEKKRR